MPRTHFWHVQGCPSGEIDAHHQVNVLKRREVPRVEYVSYPCFNIPDSAGPKQRAAAGYAKNLTSLAWIKKGCPKHRRKRVPARVQNAGSSAVDQSLNKPADDTHVPGCSHRTDAPYAVIDMQDEIGVLEEDVFSCRSAYSRV